MSDLANDIFAIGLIGFVVLCFYMPLKAILRWKAISQKERIIGIALLPVACFVFYATWDVFRSARLKAQDITCQDNMEQLGLAMLEYSEDNNNCMPSSRWCDAISGYMHGDSATKQATLHCPAAWNVKYGYAMNSAMTFVSEDAAWMKPDETVLLFESDAGTRNAQGSAHDVAITRHHGGANYENLDGHVQYLYSPGIDRAAGYPISSLVWLPPSK